MSFSGVGLDTWCHKEGGASGFYLGGLRVSFSDFTTTIMGKGKHPKLYAFLLWLM
jgi:hypothetical protein